MARDRRDTKDYFNAKSHDNGSDSDHDEQIRQAPYLPRVQIWARDGGPYTLRVGHQWFHCDELILNGSEFGQNSRSHKAGQSRQAPNTSGNNTSPQSSQRPKSGSSNRAQSYQRVRPDKQPVSSAVSTKAGNDRPISHNKYQPQSLPTPKEQAEKRRAERRQQEQLETQKHVSRERRDSGTAMADDPSTYGALVKYSDPPPATSTQTSDLSSKPSRPSAPRRGSSRNGSYLIPVRSKARKNVRFAALPR